MTADGAQICAQASPKPYVQTGAHAKSEWDLSLSLIHKEQEKRTRVTKFFLGPSQPSGNSSKLHACLSSFFGPPLPGISNPFLGGRSMEIF